MNNNTSIRNLKSSGGREKEAMNLYHLSLEMGNARDRYKTMYRNPSLLQGNKINFFFLIFCDFSTYEQDENEFCFSMQCLLLCAETDYSERKAEI